MPNELLPTNIGFGTVVGRFGSAPLIAGDADGFPDFSPAAGLTVTFTPSTAAVIDATASPAPVTIEMVPIVCGLDTQGYLVGGDGQRGVKLIATDDTDINPSGWTYSVTFLRGGAKVAAFRDFSMSLPSGTTKDIALTIPVPSSEGVSLSQAQAAEAAAVSAASAASASAAAAAASVATFSVDNLPQATTVGKAVAKATDQAAARTAIDAVSTATIAAARANDAAMNQHPARKLDAEGLRGALAYYEYRSRYATWTVLRTVTVANDTELAAAVASLLPGDEIVVTGNVSNNYVIDITATATNPVIIRAVTPLAVKFAGQMNVRNARYIYVIGFDFDLTGSFLVNGVTGGLNGSNNKLVGCRLAGGRVHVDLQGGASNNEILFCEFDGTGGTSGQGVCVKLNNDVPSARTYGNRIAYCWFHDFSTPEVNGSEPVQVGQNINSTTWDTGTVIEFNLFERCTRDDELISVKSSGNLVRWNEFRDSTRTGDGSWLTLRNGVGNQAIENLLIDCQGIRAWGDDVLIIGNTLINGSIEIMSGDSTQDNVASSAQLRPATRRAQVRGNTLNGGTITVGAGTGNTPTVSSTNTLVYGNLNATVLIATATSTDQSTMIPAWTYNPLLARVR